MKTKILLIISALIFTSVSAQEKNDKVGAWYMYFGSAQFKDSQFGMQGDLQYRNHNLGGDLEQLLVRAAVTYSLKDKSAKLALGYANITTGAEGESTDVTTESRIYQEIMLPQKVAKIFYLNHRFRYEQRFVEDQDFRTRYRYNLFVNVPLNAKEIKKKTVYLALYNELFINGQTEIGNGREVEYFDRNRFYSGLGYMFSPKIKAQLGYMTQSTNAQSKGQMQISLHHTF